MKIIGIDLGTTNSVLSVYENDKAHTLSIDGDLLLPSVVHLSEEGFTVGKTAKHLLVLEPENTIASVKRKMGQDIEISIGAKKMRPEEISSVILKKIKKVAADYFKQDASELIRAVITVPAYFTEEQRGATKQAAESAGLKVERIINEPTAAALAFGMSNLEEALYAVYDLGGGTFDVSVIESDGGLVEVLATSGNNQLGGDDFDELLADFIWEKFKENNKLSSFNADRRIRAKLLQTAEKAKIDLSKRGQIEIEESFFLKHKEKDYHLELILSRAEFEDLIRQKIQETVDLLQAAIADSKMKLDDVEGILLVGGSSRIPLISQMIEDQTGILPQLMDLPDEAVAHGAAVQGAIIDGVEIKTILVDITPHSLGVETRDDLTDRRMLEAISREDFDPESYEQDLANSILIRKNTPIPVKKTDTFQASHAFQDKFQIRILQGENKRSEGNRVIGECLLEVENPPEYAEVEVSFKLDINGILEIEAKELSTGVKVESTFKSSRGQKTLVKQHDEEAVILEEGLDTVLIKRAEKALELKGVAEEDAEELKNLITRYQRAHLNNEESAAEEVKTEILELLYFLESNN